VDCGNDASLNITGAITIEAWVKLDQEAGDDINIVNKTGDNYYGYSLSVYTNKSRVCTNSCRLGTKNIKDDNWHHVVGTISLTTYYLYVDGVLDGTGSINAIQISNSTVKIGRYSPSPIYYFKGTIDDVRIYNRALSAGEIQYLYTKTQARYK